MSMRVKLQDVLEAIEIQQPGWTSFLNRETGAIVTLTDGGEVIAEDEDFDRGVLDDEPYVALPDTFEVHEWSIMERFTHDRPDREREELLDAIHGRGAFRAFKTSIRRLGIEQEWFRYLAAALEEIAREWLESNGIPYEVEPTAQLGPDRAGPS
jgi:hypothetical protein